MTNQNALNDEMLIRVNGGMVAGLEDISGGELDEFLRDDEQERTGQ